MPNPLNAPAQRVFTAQTFIAVLERFAQLLERFETDINSLNVFPVPDADTGTNSLATVRSATSHLVPSQATPTQSSEADALDAVAQLAAELMARHAQGNSGVILAGYFQGIAQAVEVTTPFAKWPSVLQQAAQVARACVMNPEEGTMLTLADVVAQVAYEVSTQDSASAVDESAYVLSVVAHAQEALNQTTGQLEQLQNAGVVDAGAFVLSLFHVAVAECVTGERVSSFEVPTSPCGIDHQYQGPAYELMFTFIGGQESLELIQAHFVTVGDSVTVTRHSAGTIVHVHIDDPDGAVFFAKQYGAIHDVRIAPIVQDLDPAHESMGRGTDVFVLCVDETLAEYVQRCGALVVDESATQLLHALKSASGSASGSAQISTEANDLLLVIADDQPGSAQLRALCADLKRVHVMTVSTVLDAVIGCSVVDSNQALQQNLEVINNALSQLRTGGIFQLTSSSSPHQSAIEDILSAVDTAAVVQETDTELLAAFIKLAEELIDKNVEYVTVIWSTQLATLAMEYLQEHYPHVTLESVATKNAEWNRSGWLCLMGVE